MTIKTETCLHGFEPDETCEACQLQAVHLASLPTDGSDEWYDRADRILLALDAQLLQAKRAIRDGSGKFGITPTRRKIGEHGIVRYEPCSLEEARADQFMREVEYLGDLCHAVAFPESGDPWDAKR